MAGTFVVVSFSEKDDRYFKRQQSSLIDRNIYDVSPASVPYRAKSVQLSGQVAGVVAPATVQVWRNSVLQGTITTRSNGTFEVGIPLSRGKNVIEARKVSGEIVGTQVYLNAYTYNTFLSSYAGEFSGDRTTIEQVRQDAYLNDGLTIDGATINTSSSALRDNFGQYVSGRRFSTHSNNQYRDFLKKLFEAYRLSTSVESFDLLSMAYGGALWTPRFFKNGTDAYTTGGGLKLTLRGFAGFTLDHTAVDFWMYRRWLRLAASSITLAANKKYWLYVDGDVLAHNLIELKAMPILDADADVPLRELKSRTETIPSSLIRYDTTGRVTGVVGTAYVRVDRSPVTVSTIQGTVIGTLSATCTIAKGTRIICLGISTPAVQIGNVIATYTFNREVRTLARVTTDGTNVTKVEYNGRIRKLDSPDGTCNGAQCISYGSRFNAFIYIVPNKHLIPADLNADLNVLLDEVKPAHKLILEYGEPVAVGTDLFPFPLSAEIGATTRGQIDTIDTISLEIGATTRGQQDSDVVEPLSADLGGTSRYRTLS